MKTIESQLLNDLGDGKEDTREYISLLKSKIEHEDNLICNRINWLWVIQGGLLAMYLTQTINIPHVKSAIIIIGYISTFILFRVIYFGQKCIDGLHLYFDFLYDVKLNGKQDILFIKKHERMMVIGNNKGKLTDIFSFEGSETFFSYLKRKICSIMKNPGYIATMIFFCIWTVLFVYKMKMFFNH